MVENIPDMDAILAQMKEKFLETAQEKLDRLNEILHELSAGDGTDAALLEEFRRDIHSLKGMGGTFQMPLVTKLCHSFEAFIEGEAVFSEEIISASHLFVDRITDLIDSDDEADDAGSMHWMEGLPQKGQVIVEEKTDSSESLVLVISENSEQRAIIEASFIENSFRVLSVNNPFDGYKMAFQKKPELIISSQVFKNMNGAEFLRSLGATETFAKAKFAMICPDRRKALEENLHGVQLLSEKNVEVDILNFIAISITA